MVTSKGIKLRAIAAELDRLAAQVRAMADLDEGVAKVRALAKKKKKVEAKKVAKSKAAKKRAGATKKVAKRKTDRRQTDLEDFLPKKARGGRKTVRKATTRPVKRKTVRKTGRSKWTTSSTKSL